MSDVVTVGVRAEAFRPVDAVGSAELAAIPEPGSRELLGGETVFTARIGEELLLVRLFGTIAALPDRVAAPVASLHFFDRAGRRLGP